MGEQSALPGYSRGVDNWQAKFSTLKDRLSYAVMNEEFTDTVFLVGSKKERISCNKLMLCVNSSVFATMLNSRWHRENSEICIPDVEPPAFRLFLNYMYTEEMKRRTQINDAISMMYLAKKYDVPKLAHKCVMLLAAGLNTGNAASIFQKSRLLQEIELEKMALQFICKNAKRVFAAEDYLNLAQENLAYLLQKDELKIDELSLINAVYLWAQEECKREELELTLENYRLVLKECVKLLRFPLLTAEEFTLQVADKGLLSDSDVIAILKYHTISASKLPDLPKLPFNSDPRTPLFSNVRYSVNRFNGLRSSPQPRDYSSWKSCCFQVNRPISIVSVGLYGPTEKVTLPVNYEVEIKIIDSELKLPAAYIQRTVSVDKILQAPGQVYSGRIFHVEFDGPVRIVPFMWYTISFQLQKGPMTLMGDDKKTEVKVQCGFDEVTFKFKDAKSNNTIYQIPEICFVLF